MSDRINFLLRGPLRRNGMLFAAVFAHVVAAAAVGVALGEPYRPGMAGTLLTLFRILLPIFLMGLLVWRVAYVAVRVRPERPIHWLLADLRQTLLDPDRIVAGVTGMIAVAAFTASFSFVKPLIPQMHPFDWDVSFAAFDRALLGGHTAYELLLPALGSPVALKTLNIAYHAWFFLFYFVAFLACFSKARDRNVFLVAFVLTWAVGGNVLATALSSAGPVYFERLGFGDDFVPLMDLLHQVNARTTLWSLDVQELLWSSYLGEVPPRGISAMPSMHVAVATLMALYGGRHARWAGICLALFAATIFLGSIMLGWHYAADGIAGALVALGAWAVARRLVEGRQAPFPENPRQAGAPAGMC